MNETANATFARRAPGHGARPAGGRGDGGDGRRPRAQHRDALRALDRGDAARREQPAAPSCSTRSVRARRATGRKRRRASSTSSRSPSSAGTPRRLQPCGPRSEIRGVESIGAADSGADLARAAAEVLGTVAAVTGPTDYVSDGERVIAVSNGHELLGAVSGTGCMSTAITGAFPRASGSAARAAAEALVAFGVAGEEAARDAKGPGTFHALLYDGSTTSTRIRWTAAPGCRNEAPRDRRRPGSPGRRSRVERQWSMRLKDASTEELIDRGAPFRLLSEQMNVTFVVNDDVQAALALLADGVHLGREDEGMDLALEAGMLVGCSASTPEAASRRRRTGPSTSARDRSGRRRANQTPNRSASRGFATSATWFASP